MLQASKTGFIIYYSIINYLNIVNRPRNGYETVGNIKVISMNNFQQPEVAGKADHVKN